MHTATQRAELLLKIGPNVSVKDIHPALLYGVVPAMAPHWDLTFWGTNIDHCDEEGQKTLGVQRTFASQNKHDKKQITLSEQDIANIHEFTTNGGYARTHPDSISITAAQILAAHKHIAPKWDDLIMPEPCDDLPPDHVNMFADGAFMNPTNQAWSLGAAGTWTSLPQQPHDTTNPAFATERLMQPCNAQPTLRRLE